MTSGDTPVGASVQAELDRFVLLAFHDLRAPLRRGLLLAQLLERSAAGTMNSTSEAHLAALLDANRAANALLARLVQYCQAGCGLDFLPPVSAAILVRNAIQMIGGRLEAEIEGEDLPCLVPPPLQQVFFEILDNALKFGRGAPSVRISTKRTASERIFEIQDAGIGFDNRYAETIWEPLQRLHGAGDYPGYGLGLAISRRIVAGLNGRTWAISTPGEGSTFCFSVPLAGASAPE